MAEIEIWKDIPGYEGQYQVSNLGRVKSLSRTVKSRNQSTNFDIQVKEHILRPGKCDKYRHQSVVLNRKSFLVHKLVMLTFIGPAPEGKEVCHNNCDATDNRLSNLRYDTRRENVMDVYRNGRSWKKLTVDDVRAIRECHRQGMTTHEIGEKYGVVHQTVSKVLTGRTFSWVE